MGWEQILKLAIDEWGATAIFLGSVVGIVWAIFHFLYKHQLANLRSTITNEQSIVKLRNATIDGLETEIEKLTEEIAKSQSNAGPPELLPVTHGSNAIRALYAEVTSYPSVPLPTHPTDSTKWKHFIFQHPEEFERVAAARRLTEAGLARVNEPAPGTYTLTASTEAIDLRSIFDQYIKDEKKKD